MDVNAGSEVIHIRGRGVPAAERLGRESTDERVAALVRVARGNPRVNALSRRLLTLLGGHYAGGLHTAYHEVATGLKDRQGAWHRYGGVGAIWSEEADAK